MKNPFRVSIVLALIASSFLVINPAHAATIIVNTTADEAGTGAGCALREAVIAANTNAAVSGCPAGTAGADIITLPAGTYALSVGPAGDDAAANGDLDITEGLTINGASAPTTIVDGAQLDRVFDVRPGVSSVLITDLTVTRGRTDGHGGGIQTESPLEARRLLFSANETTSMDGGGIGLTADANSRVTVSDTTFAGNTAANWGGAVNTYGANSVTPSVFTNVTMSGNSAVGAGGAITTYNPHPVILNNVTIIGNRADTDGDEMDGGGGIWAGGSGADQLIVRNSIVAGNSSGTAAGPDCDATNPGSSGITSGGHNIIGDQTDCIITPATGDQVGTAAVPVDPGTGPLADNGGPTMTHALLVSSPAIDAGDPATPGSGGNACPAADQRGAPRNCDIGAYELVTCLGVTVNRVGTSGDDALTGTDAADGFLAGDGNDTATGLVGHDAFCLEGGDDTASGGPGNDAILGGPGNDTSDGGDGDDLIEGGDGDDIATGGAGNDQIRGEAGNDTGDGGEGNDTFLGGVGNDVGKGAAGRDLLEGEKGKDRLKGGSGKDRLLGGGGKDRLNCGAGKNEVGKGGPGGDKALKCEKGKA